MNCSSTALYDLAYGLLDGADPGLTQSHLAECERCRWDLDRVRQERDLFEEAVRHLPVEERGIPTAAARRGPRRILRLVHVGYAAALFIGLVAILFLPPGGSPREDSKAPVEHPGHRQDPAPPDPEALIRRLGADDLADREKASAALQKLGLKAEPFLRKALESEDVEIRTRAAGLLERIREDVRREKILAFRGKSLGDRLGGKRNAVLGGGGGGDTEDAVLGALRWLSRHQSADGSWGAKSHDKECGKLAKYARTACSAKGGNAEHDLGVTGLALLAFLGAGYSHLSKDTYDGICFGHVVRDGLDWLASQQDARGCIWIATSTKAMYGHAISTLALSEICSFTRSDRYEGTAQKAVDFLVAARNPGAGWRYTSRCGDSDTSVTMWAALALRVAWHAGFDVPDAVFDGAKTWFDQVTDEKYSRVGYTHRGTGKVFIPGQNDHFSHHETLTAGAAFNRMLLGTKANSPAVRPGVELLLRDLPKWEEKEIDGYYWHWATLALFQQDGPDGEKWKKWNEKLKEVLLRNQRPASEGCKQGSWDPVDRWSAEGGRVYVTALNSLTLETYYRYRIVPRE